MNRPCLYSGVLVLLICGLFGCRLGRKAGGPSSNGTTPRLEAIGRGLSFLLRDRSDPSALIALDYLQRKYDLPGNLTFEQTAPQSLESLGRWRRFLDKNSPVDEHYFAADDLRAETEQLVMRALYCDSVQLAAGYGAILKEYLIGGHYEGYELTHTAFILKFLQDNNCPFDPELGNEIRQETRCRLLEFLTRPQVRPDARYEALAVLQDLLLDRTLPDQHFVALLSDQRPDGGWAPLKTLPSAPHPTVLAVWALLAREHPNTTRIPFARR